MGIRRGYTLLELLVVLAVLLILGLAVSLTMEGNYANTRQKAAADLIRARIADARSRAIERGEWFRVAVSEDGTRLRVAPDTPQFATYAANEAPAFLATVTEDRFDKATAAVLADSGQEPARDGEWITIATLKPDGTCKEEQVLVEVREGDLAPIYIRVRGVTGTASVVRQPPPNLPGGRP